jgi:hypothetical protein
VSKQREYMDFMLNGELQFLKRTASEDKCELVKEEKMSAMHSAMEQFAKVGGKVVESNVIDKDESNDNEQVIDKEESNDDELDEAALAEAADAIKEAMRTANGFVNNSAEGSAEDEEEEDESDEEADEADIDAAINDASTDEDSDEE